MRRLLLLGVVAFYATNLNAGIANAEADFAGNFFKAVAEETSENMICSPISAEFSVIAAALGAEGETLNQIRSVVTNSHKDGMGRVNTFINNLNSYKDIELRIASNVFVAQGYTLKPRFKSLVQTLFKSAVENIDFRNAVEASRTINNWSAAHTDNRIKDLVSPDSISQDSAVLIMNAVYFKGPWANPFLANETQLRPFHVNGRTIEYVPTMYRMGKYFYGQLRELRASFIEIPYMSPDIAHAVSMYIILPHDVNGFVELKKNLDKINISMLRDNAASGEVELFLPKFKIESSLELTDPLIKLGLTDMFSNNANFNGIVEHGNLKITKVIQKAFLEVNEEGSEAGAVTEADLADRISPPALYRFVVDRPFFSLVATESELMLFSAITVDPRSETKPTLSPDRIIFC